MKTFLKHIAAAAALAATALAASTGAHAAAIGIDGTTPGSITFSACDFEGGMTINGMAMGGCGVGAGGSVTLPTSTISFSGTWITPGAQADTGTVDVYFTSADDPTSYASLLSYSIVDAGGTSSIVGSFTTGFSGIIGAVPGGAMTAIAGTPFNFDYAFLTAGVSTAAVSAPASLALAGLALAAAGLASRRRA
jgi:hypothetical protein